MRSRGGREERKAGRGAQPKSFLLLVLKEGRRREEDVLGTEGEEKTGLVLYLLFFTHFVSSSKGWGKEEREGGREGGREKVKNG